MSSSPTPPSDHPKIVFIVGAPGAGKSTLSALLTRTYPHLYHLPVGAYMRSCLHAGDFGAAHADAAQHLQHGTLIPREILAPLLKRKIDAESRERGRRWFLVEGFPRNMEQVTWFEREIAAPHLVIDLYCSFPEARARALTRRHLLDRAATATEDIFARRTTEFDRCNTGIVQYYSVLGKLLVLETEGPVEAVFATLLEKMRGREEAEALLAAAQGEGGGPEGTRAAQGGEGEPEGWLAKLEEEPEEAKEEVEYDNWGIT